ncbi:MAG: hypothetical protein ABI851_13870 [Saprospiraceae bacterium]
MNIIQRIKSPTPIFFKKLRNIGLALAAISATILTAPVSFPIIAITAAQYIGVLSAVISAVSQFTIGNDPIELPIFDSEENLINSK